MLKKGLFLAALSYTIFLTVVSLIQLKNLPEVNISFGDKIFHFGAYAVLSVLWFYSFLVTFRFKFVKALVTAAIFSIAFGIIIEVLQESLTAYRALDIYDALANTLGVLLASLILWVTKKLHAKNL